MLPATLQDEYAVEKQKVLQSYFQDLLDVMVEKLGLQQANAWFHRHGVASSGYHVMADELTFRQYVNLLADIESQNTYPGIGLTLGKMKSVLNFGVYGYALLSTSTYSQFTAVADRIFYAIYENIAIAHKVIDDYLYISYLPNDTVRGPGYITIMEQVVMCGVSLMQSQLPRHLSWQECRVHCNYAKPAHYRKFNECFGGLVAYEKPLMQLCVPASWMRLPLTSGAPFIASMCTERFEALLGNYAQDNSFTGQIKHILLSANFNQLPSISQISAHFHMAERTLRKKLAEEGQSFRNILMQVRHDLAKRYLLSSDLSIQEIAFSLGYTHPQNFFRVFRKLENITPEQFRLQDKM